MRIERDLLGEKEIPQDVLYGIHSLRAKENFTLSGQKVHQKLIKAMVLIKKAAAETNEFLGYLSSEKSRAIVQAANEILEGKWQDHFIVDAFQGGAGTSTNMNVNEVIANRAIQIMGGKCGQYDIIHPINDINRHQSTNDVYPTALRIAAIWQMEELSNQCAVLQKSLQEKEQEFANILKVGRTQLQEAVPMMIGQEFGAYAQAIARDRWRIYKIEERLRQVNLGGTAIGTGLNADRKYVYMVNEKIRTYAQVAIAKAEDTIDATQNADVFVEASGLLKALAVNLGKIAHDLRLLSSGPRSGFGEVILPQRQAGSSIMPGKVNPIIPEAVNQICFQVISSDLAIAIAAQSGQLELNAFMPFIAHHLLTSTSLLINAVSMLDEKCIQGIAVNESQCNKNLEQSLATATALVPYIGYDLASEVAKEAQKRKCTIPEAAQQLGVLSEEKLLEILKPENMTHPHQRKTNLLRKDL